MFQKVCEYSSLDLLLCKVPKWPSQWGFLNHESCPSASHRCFCNAAQRIYKPRVSNKKLYIRVWNWIQRGKVKHLAGVFLVSFMGRFLVVTCLRRTVTQYFSTHKCKSINFAHVLYACIMYVLLWLVNHRPQELQQQSSWSNSLELFKCRSTRSYIVEILMCFVI